VLKFWRSLHVSEEDFYAALARVLPYREVIAEAEDDEEIGEDICGPTCSLLAREFGESPKYWLFEAPIDLATAMTADYTERMQREADAARKQRSAKGKHSSGTRSPGAPQATPKMYAQKKLRTYCKALEKRWQTIKPNSSLNLTTA
jgi:hypothetical protein